MSADPDYWVIVALQPDHGEAWILQASKDAKDRDVITGSALSDDGVSRAWMKGRGWGLYKLALKPWSHGPDMNGEYDCGVDVASVEIIHEIAPHMTAPDRREP